MCALRDARAFASGLSLLFIPFAPIGAAPAGTGPGGRPHPVHAIIDARIVPAPGRLIERGSIVIRDGLVVEVGENIALPAGARVHSGAGLTVYAGLIEPYLRRELGDATDAPVGHENRFVTPERRAVEHLSLSDTELRALRQAGFTSALVVPSHGVFRGTSALVALSGADAGASTIRSDVAQHVAFDVSGDETYPNSPMGAVALVRQTLIDARHASEVSAAYAREPLHRERPPASPALDALRPVLDGTLPIMLETDRATRAVRAAAILSELDIRPILVTGNSDEYRWIDDVRGPGCELVVSLNLPPAPAWESDLDRRQVDIASLVHWDRAPSNAAALHDADVSFSFTASGLLAPGEWRARTRQAIARGLPPEVALAAVTTEPARLLGVEDRLGRIVPGGIANLTICDGDLFDENASIVGVWIDGRFFDAITDIPDSDDLAGTWQLDASNVAVALAISTAGDSLSISARPRGGDGDTLALRDVSLRLGSLRAVLPAAVAPGGPWYLVARIDGNRLAGTLHAGESRIEVRGRRVEHDRSDSADASENDGTDPLFPVSEGAATWPPLAAETPRVVLIREATIWTQGPMGIVENGDVLIRDGRIDHIGVDVEAPSGALVIDAKGMHVTPGLIDAHSHGLLAGSANECSGTCTAEVRMADEIDPESRDIYGFLAGGTTTANILHGSCNPIGGQSAVVKMRWGSNADGLLIDDAPPGIKLALGENPKWDFVEGPQTRYPATRPGVEQSIRERFLAARAYADRLERGRVAGVSPRRDLQLEALAEVLDGTRQVHCHAYRQDDMIMLVRLAEELGFRVRAFHHALEAYKIADRLTAAGVGVSLLSDWWSTKHETREGIPYNAALCHTRGVVTSFHSDNLAIARRLNHEAAKAVTYGGVPEQEALSMVTLYPAQQLGLDHRVGSLEAGKDADLVIWSGHPLSNLSRCEETWIEGRRYFSRTGDLAAREEMEALRERLLDAAENAPFTRRTYEWTPAFGGGEASRQLAVGACMTEGGDSP